MTEVLTTDTASPTTLALVSSARAALAEARTLPDIRRVMEAATVAADAQRRAARLAEATGLAADVVKAANDAANDAAAVRIEAQAKAGEILALMPKHPPGPDRAQNVGDLPPTLAEIGVSDMQSSRWQQVASIPETVREEYLETTRETGGEVSTAGLVRWDLERRASEDDAKAREEVEKDPEVARAKLRAIFSLARLEIKRDLLPLSPGEVVKVLHADEYDDALEDLRDTVRWCERTEEHIRYAREGKGK